MFSYPCLVLPEEDGGFAVTFPDFPEAVTQGLTKDEAYAAASDCLDEAIASRILNREHLPQASANSSPNVIHPSSAIALKAALYNVVQELSLSNVALARRLNLAETEARRLLDPRHRTRLDGLEKALKGLGKKLTISVT